MRKVKYFAAMAAAAIMMVGTTMTSFAREYQYKTGSTEIIEDEYGKWASGRNYECPGWLWINGYCYYNTDYQGNKLTSCVTPDGYTVDEEGRWTVDGVPQSNGYGSFVMGTDELYSNKSDDEIWAAMKAELEQLFATHVIGSSSSVAMASGDGYVCGRWSKEGFGSYDITRNPTNDLSLYIDAQFVNTWNDCPETYVALKNEMLEKAIKLVCGDHVGQELFNDIKAAADPGEGGPREEPVFDENGKLIFINDYQIQTKIVQNYTDGVNFKYFDLNKWNGRKTDYGKEFRIVPVGEIDDNWHIYIKK